MQPTHLYKIRPRQDKRGIDLISDASSASTKRGLPFYRQTGESTSQKSIAVLPFENLSRDPDNAYFADGVQEEILTRLAKIADLKVISRTSTQLYQSKPGNLAEIAKQLWPFALSLARA
jgi:TolB-like protein